MERRLRRLNGFTQINNFIMFVFLFLLLISPLAAQMHEALCLSPLITDGMVLQRDKPNLLKGKGIPGEPVTIRLANEKFDTFVREDGQWQVETGSLAAGGPYTMAVYSSGDTLYVNDILIGDIWICSGQSNMEYTVASFPWAQQEMEEAKKGKIRFYTLPNSLDLIPSDEIPAGRWLDASGEDLNRLSATAWFFAKYIEQETHVPVGLIVSAWSGTAIEPWMEKESLRLFPQFEEVLAELDGYTRSRKEVEESFARYRREEWDEKYYLKGKGMEEQWYLPETDFSDWQPIRNPGYWEDAGIGLEEYDGAVWYKTEFDLPADFSAPSFHLFLSYIKDYSRVWVNGHFVGETFGDKNWNDYYVPAEYLLQEGNVLVIRVLNVEGKGGIHYHPLWETPILAGSWVCKPDYRIDPATFPKPQIVNVNPFSTPTLLYNAMIHPLRDCAVTGFIWYQGESNVGRGYEYRTLFPVMIDSWRTLFRQGDLPFYFVQLANHLPEAKVPGDSQWAELRESQACALSLPATGMAVAIDIGEAYDIHPQNKQEVGRRLALQALYKTYGKETASESPAFKTVRFEQGKAEIEVRTVSELRKVIEDAPIRGFEIAGSDGKFCPAQAKITGSNRLEVFAPAITTPVAVRYAWADNPGTLNIINGAGLPLVPFRTDSFKGITDDRTFSLHHFYF